MTRDRLKFMALLVLLMNLVLNCEKILDKVELIKENTLYRSYTRKQFRFLNLTYFFVNAL